MAVHKSKEALARDIDTTITTNGNREITGFNLNEIFNDLNESLINKESIAQETGNDEQAIMSQKAITQAIPWKQDPEQSHIHYSNGNVGIGTASPGRTLDITGDVGISGKLHINDAALTINGAEVTASVADLNKANLLNATAGQLTAGKALVVDVNSEINQIKAGNIDISGSQVKATETAGLSLFNQANQGITIDDTGDTNISSKLRIDDAALTINGTEVTASAAEFNKLTGLTATTAELNKLDGLTAATTDLNKVDLLNATAGQLTAGKALVVDVNSEINRIKAGTIDISGSQVKSTGAAGLSLFNQTDQGITIDDTGNVGIGTGSPGYTLHVNGNAAKPGGGSWADTSDQRLKKNIKVIEGKEALSKILRLQGVTYEWIHSREHENGVRAGIIAQELEKVFPDWVKAVEPGEKDKALIPEGEKAKAISFPHDFNAYLIEAIKAQQKTIETQSMQNENLSTKISHLETEHQQIKAALEQLKQVVKNQRPDSHSI